MSESKTESSTQFAKGLEGVIAAEQPLSLVDGANSKLSYRGIQIHELAEQSNFEEVTYLLWYGKLPNQKELTAFRKDLGANRKAHPEIIRLLKSFPAKAHPMGVLRSVVSSMGLFDPKADGISPQVSLEQSLRVTAQIPTVIAAHFRIRNGKDPIEPREDLPQAENFLYMLNGTQPTAEMIRALDAYLVLLADHGLNASTFSARVTMSTNSDLYSAVTAAIGTLKGDLHGSANQRAMELIHDIGEPKNAESYIMKLFAEKKKVMGFGHRIYKHKDPRAVVFHKIAEDLCAKAGHAKWMEISNIVERVVWEQKQIPCNVDFYSASVLSVLGFPIDFFTTVFAASRIAGWTAHIMDQQSHNRLIRPDCLYTGPRDQSYIPMAKRP